MISLYKNKNDIQNCNNYIVLSCEPHYEGLEKDGEVGAEEECNYFQELI